MAEIRRCGKVGWIFCDGNCANCAITATSYTSSTNCSKAPIPIEMKPPVNVYTNADRIRAMSDEELAAWLDELVEHNWLDYLKQEVEL